MKVGEREGENEEGCTTRRNRKKQRKKYRGRKEDGANYGLRLK